MARRLARIAALSTVLAPSIAAALGVGSIQTESALNEPLEARIPLESADSEELETLSATLASPDAFERAGLERPFMLSQLDFEVVTDAAEPYVVVSTSDPVREPFLAFLVELNWAGGRLVREYTLLLDPPVHSPEEDAAPAPADAPAPDAPADEDVATATPGDPGEPDPVADAPEEIEVQSNDTLWEIADEARQGTDASVHQMMMALLAANPDAFIDDNVNNVRAGAILRVPDRDEAVALSAADARQEYSRQVEAWQAGRAPDPAPPDESEVADEADQPDVVDGRLEVVAAGDTAGDDATASLLDEDVDASPETVARLQAELAAAREDEASLRSENERLRAQTDELLERVEALERTLDVQVQGALPGMPQEPAEEDVPLADDEPGVTDEDEEAVAAEEAADTDEAVAAGDEQDPAGTAVDEPAATQPQAPWEDPRNLSLAGAALAALMLLALLIVRRRRNAATDASEEVEASLAAAMAAGSAAQDEDAGDEPGQAADDASRPLVDDEFEPAITRAGGADPVEEAEINLAYGRYDQARNLLTTAVAEDPERKDLRLKLLEAHSLSGDRPAFEADAQALYGLVDGETDPVWQRASEMGREIAPENPLFGGADDAPLMPPEPADENDPFAGMLAEQPAGDEQPEPAAPVPAEATDEADEDDFSDLEFSLDEPPAEPAEKRDATAAAPADDPGEGTEDDAFSLDFELDDMAAPDGPRETAAEPAEAGGTGGLDDDAFSLDFEVPDRPEPETGETAASPDGEDDDALTFSLDDLDTGTGAGDEEEGLGYAPETVSDELGPAEDARDSGAATEPAAPDTADAEATAGTESAEDPDDALFDVGDENSTKLDLARAYLDMGDSEGARSLLDEVLEEGSDSQKAEARTLYAEAE
ncbi:FimV/HubP family polar landmark protein [Aquisalimonas asiatica]|uniref:Pilus assembly protein FimV n=1 Tax=Aquisalimonas asiatica TaxID=406100 RepID=A0A1H8RQ23_9GAMM|nr:FimV/HubP family polar landmark protein [Aquisalimonas asiatica]SEO68053.1 pilus assembly protein FimV [Aquisalimonas asiatica]